MRIRRAIAGPSSADRAISGDSKAYHKLSYLTAARYAMHPIEDACKTNIKGIPSSPKKNPAGAGFFLSINHLELVSQFHAHGSWPVHGTCSKQCGDREEYFVTLIGQVFTEGNQCPLLGVVPNRC